MISHLKWFEGFILQTMFLRGVVDGVEIDSMRSDLLEGWQKMALELQPREVMLYTSIENHRFPRLKRFQ